MKKNNTRGKVAGKPGKSTGKCTRRRRARKKTKVSVHWFSAVAAAAVITLLAVPLTMRLCSEEGEVKVPDGNYGYAVDISKYQRDIVWDSLMVLTDARGRTVRDIKGAAEIHRVKYTIIKATEGEKHRDALFTDHWQHASEAGYSRGAYHFFLSSRSPESQAENFIRTVGNIRRKDLPPILDVETVHPGCSDAELNRRMLVWLKAVEKHYGRRPVIYTGDSFLKDRLSPEIYGNYPIWIARYGSEPRFGGWFMWQFTDRASVYGIPSPCDLSVVK